MTEKLFTDKVGARDIETTINRTTPSGTMESAPVRRPLRAKIVLVVVLLSIVGMALFALRRPILRTAGWMLIVNDRVGPVDVIVVTVAADGAGVLEAADLVHRNVASRVAVFSLPPDTVEHEFVRRGIPYENAAAQSVGQLRALGVENTDLIQTYVDGSEDEGPVLAAWCDRQKLRSVVVVSTSDHSRRLRRVLHRSMHGHQTTFAVRSSRYSVFDPDRWWQSRVGIRTEVAELEKLLRDVVRHPIS